MIYSFWYQRVWTGPNYPVHIAITQAFSTDPEKLVDSWKRLSKYMPYQFHIVSEPKHFRDIHLLKDLGSGHFVLQSQLI